MVIITLKGNGEIRTRRRTKRTEIDAPYKGDIITFVYPMYCHGWHARVMGDIDSDNLLRPTTAETLSFVDLALQNPEELHCTEILKRFRKNCLWTGTESLSFPEGVLVYDNSDGKMPNDRTGLIKLLDKNDNRVRLVKPGFATGIMPIPKFLKHPYVIAQVGEDMLEVVERIAESCNKKDAYVFGLDRADKDTKRYTAVDSGWYVSLSLGGGCLGDGRDGYASGVLK